MQQIYEHARERPASPALIHNGETITYAAFAAAITAATEHLENQALPVGQTIVVLVSKLPDSWVAIFALQSLGLNTVCIGSPEILQYLDLENVFAYLVTEADIARHQLSPNSLPGSRILTLPTPDYRSDNVAAIPARQGSPNTGNHTLYTSGTTGKYKKLLLDARLQAARDTERAENLPYSANTYYYCGGFSTWTGAGYKFPRAVWRVGGCIIFDQREDWYRFFPHPGMTHALLVPPQLNELLDHMNKAQTAPVLSDYYLMVGGGFVTRKSAARALECLTVNFNNVVSSTEINLPILACRVEDLDELHWVLPTGFRAVEIVNEEGNSCAPGTEGQLRVRATELDYLPYQGDDATNAKFFRHGYFYTGDLAVQRPDGHIRVLGRRADVINIGGQKLASAPIEEALQSQLGLPTVCLFSGVNASGEDEIVVTLESDRFPDQSVLNRIGWEFADFGQVRFAIVYPFPRTQTGTIKIDRKKLRQFVFPNESS